MIQTKDVSVLLEGWDEKMKRFFRYIGAQFIRGEGEGSKSIWNCFIPLPKLTATLTSSCKSFQVILEKWSSQHRDPSHPFPQTKDTRLLELEKGRLCVCVCVYVTSWRRKRRTNGYEINESRKSLRHVDIWRVVSARIPYRGWKDRKMRIYSVRATARRKRK